MDVEKLSFIIPTVDSKYQTITEHQSHIFRTKGHNVFEDPLCICAYKYQSNADWHYSEPLHGKNA
jgi:hypothetical protein